MCKLMYKVWSASTLYGNDVPDWFKEFKKDYKVRFVDGKYNYIRGDGTFIKSSIIDYFLFNVKTKKVRHITFKKFMKELGKYNVTMNGNEALLFKKDIAK